MRTTIFAALLCVLVLHATSALGQFKKKTAKDENWGPNAVSGCTLGDPKTLYWECGFTIIARGACSNITGTIPIPVDWPEQKVKIVEENFPAYAKVSVQKQAGGSSLLVFKINTLPAGENINLTAKFEVENYSQVGPEDVSKYKIPDPKELGNLFKKYLLPSDKIESNNRKIRALAGEIGVDAENAWAEVEAVYDWVQANVKYENGKLKGALAALEDGTGDCEELSSLFIAICRAKGVPARTVWVPDHCYAEFYLVDENGNGAWFPCQPAGDKAFGEMPFQYIVLQKGDNFTLSFDKKRKVRYLPQEIRFGKTSRNATPIVKEVHRVVEE
ncbi:MAG: transglutaminase-like domain-containing protein [Planctomycetia bacterium]|nr:transglutaminase-like domain-containing protein [Planctomycetia bacterium]